MTPFHRSTAFVAVCALAVATAAAAGCAAPVDAPVAAQAPTANGIRRVAREVHLDLPAQPAGSTLRLETAGASYAVSAHTTESRAKAPRGRLVSHFAKSVPFSTEAPQSYDVVRVDADGSRHLVLTGIAIPGSDFDPIVAGAEASAMALAFRDPSLMSIDTDVAKRVMEHVQKSPSFARLVDAITAYGGATTLDDQEKKGHAGWAVTVRSRDSKGNVIMVPAGEEPAHEATHWAIAGSSEYYKNGFKDHFRQDSSGHRERIVPPGQILAEVQRDARLAVRSDMALQGRMWSITKDTTVRQPPAKVRAMQVGEGEIDYVVDDPQWKGDRRVSIVEHEGRKVTFRVENNAWRRQGIVVRFRDIDGNLLKKADIGGSQGKQFLDFDKTLPYSSFMGVLDGRFTVLGVPFQAVNAEEYTVTLPEKAASFEVNIASVGLKREDYPGYLNGSEPEENAKLPGEVQTLLLDVAMPTMALAIGAGAERIKGSHLAKVLATVGVETALHLVAAGLASSTGVSAFNRELGMEILADLVSKTPEIAIAVAEWAAELTVQKTMMTVLPGIGEFLDAIERIGTIAQLIETIDTVAANPSFTYDRIATSETLKIVVSPKNGYFSNRATTARAAVFFGTSTVPTVTTVAIDNSANGGNGPTTIPIALPHQPVGGKVRVKVTLETPNGWVDATGEGEAENDPDKANTVTVPIAIEENPTPINQSTRYAHDSVLALRDGKRAWVKSAAVPAPGPHDCNVGDPSHPWLCGASSMTFNASGFLGYGWTGSGAELKSCTTGASSVVGSMAQTLNLNPNVGGPEALMQRTSCGASEPVFLAFDPAGSASGGRHVMVEKVGDTYQVYGIDLANKGVLAPSDPSKVLGTLSAKKLDAIALNPMTGMLLALSAADNAVEVLTLAATPTDASKAPVSKVIGGPGTSIGRLHDAAGLAFLPAGAGFLVLEGSSDGAPGRVQAFTFDGASVDKFGGEASFALTGEGPGAKVTYTDMKIDPTESYVYVSSYVNDGQSASDFRLDIYGMADGKLVSRTVGVVGAKMAVDKWRDLYTLDYQNLDGASWPEPSVSQWIAPPMKQ